MEGTKLIAATQQSLDFSGVVPGSFLLVGVFLQPVRLLFVQNLTNVLMQFSFDAIDNHFVLPGNGFLVLDAGTNKGTANTAAIAQGQGIYVTTVGITPPTSGGVYLSYWYAG